MRGGALPPALLCIALGLALAYAPPRARLWSILGLVVTDMAIVFVPIPPHWVEGIFLGCWTSTAVSALAVHLRSGLTSRGAFALSMNAGLWCGAVTALAGSRLDMLKALPCVFVVIPAAFIVARRVPIVVNVLSSWLIAVAILAATLQFLPVTPGYMPDHLE